MGRASKTVVAGLVIVGCIVGVNYWLGQSNKPQQEAVRNVTYRLPASKRPEPLRQVAGIVYLSSQGLPPNTISNLKDMGATEVYLYVAYHTDAYFHIPKNPYGLAEPADSLAPALNELHQNGFRVITVISSALLDPKLATPQGRTILQPHSSIIDPKTAAPFVLSLVQSLLQYDTDGVYVGEPYYTGGVPNPTPARQQDWTALYNDVIKAGHAHGKRVEMVLPDLYASGVAVKNTSGLPEEITKLPFDSIGIDLEDAYQGRPSDINRFSNAVRKVVYISGSRQGIIEISLRRGDLKTPVPTGFFAQEVKLAEQHNVQTILIFANEWWNVLPKSTQTAYRTALQGYLRGDSR